MSQLPAKNWKTAAFAAVAAHYKSGDNVGVRTAARDCLLAALGDRP